MEDTKLSQPITRLFQAIRGENYPAANKQFLNIMTEKMRRAIQSQYREAAQEFGQTFSQDSTQK